MDTKLRLRMLPKMDRLLADLDIQNFLNEWPRTTVIKILREVLEQKRNTILTNEMNDCHGQDLFDGVKAEAIYRLTSMSDHRLKRVINATGVILHTNLGRAPLSKIVMDRVSELAVGYCNLEYDTLEGKRRDRNTYLESLLTNLTGAEAALVVNNNAAAVYLALNTLCAGREVVVSRGEIVEIGDSFRIMDIIENSGCLIRETGATNRTRSDDYIKYIGDNTGALLKVHRSNYKISGYTEETDTQALVQLRDTYASQGCIVMEDMGSGLLIDLSKQGFHGERMVSDALRDGADIVTFSGDKLLSGPQAGVIAGKKKYIQQMKRNPLYRCLRIDKLCLAALEATLQIYAAGQYETLPVMKTLLEPVTLVRNRTESLCAMANDTAGLHLHSGPHASTPGGGARPGETIESYAVYITADGLSASEIDRFLRNQTIPIISVLHDGQVIMDLRTVEEADLPYIAEVIRRLPAIITQPTPQARNQFPPLC